MPDNRLARFREWLRDAPILAGLWLRDAPILAGLWLFDRIAGRAKSL